MLLPRKWVLSLGLLATAPGFALAGPFDGKTKSDAPAERPAAKTTARPEAGRSNDQIAQDIAKAMKAAGLKGKGIQIVVQDGEVTLTGQILDSAQLAKATQVASRVPGIENVNNELTPIQGGAPARTASRGPRQPIQQVQFEEGAEQAAPSEPAPTPVSNQAVAQGIADQLASAGLSGYDIEIRYKNGACSLIGEVSSKAEAMRAQQAAESVGGVQQVINRLTVNGQPVAPAQPMAGRGPIYPAGLAVGEGQLPPGIPPQAAMQMQMQQAQAMQAMSAMGGHPGMGGPGMGGPGMGGHPGGGIAPAGGHMMYNQPNVPEYAWPTYAQYDNYAAVTYPSQYDASAFPYIGPFYPYPQVPLNWRQSTLEWKDGHWGLRFSTKTDKWFWFMHPKNW
jgi:osmotically-inducible protein OsmY